MGVWLDILIPAGTAALEDICVARAMFGIAGGYDCELLVADSERRMLESGPEGMKILMREACYRSPGDCILSGI